MYQENLLAGHKILVTGGGSGIGLELATRYLSLGAELVICGRRQSVLDETAEKLMTEQKGVVKTYALDIRQPEAIEAMVESIWQQGPLTGLVNNAAGNFICPTEQLSANGFDAIANIVLHGTFYMTQAVSKRWLEAGDKGSIINILVTWIWQGGPYTVPSAAAKAGVANMTKSLAVEWGGRGIRINAIAPGPFRTEGAFARLQPKAVTDSLNRQGISQRSQQNPMQRTGIMSELTNLGVFLMADGVEYLTGQVIAIDGGAHLTNGGSFHYLNALDDDDWLAVRDEIQQTNARDKAKR